MSSPAETVAAELLQRWPLPEPGDTKQSKGDVVVIGGAPRSPGAAMLAGVAALRVGAGRLALAVDEAVAAHVAVAIPESGVIALRNARLDNAADDVSSANAILLGPGLDDPQTAERMLRALPALVSDTATVVLDAFALGVAPHVEEVAALAGRLILTPNKEEAARLLEVEGIDDLEAAVAAVARRYDAVVTCYGVVGHPDGRVWRVPGGGPGLATSGSGDVLAGAVAGLCARGASPEQAAVWASWLHADADDRLARSIGPLGYIATELLEQLPRSMARAVENAADPTGKLG